MKFTDSPGGRRPDGGQGMPLHLQGVLMATQFHGYRQQPGPGQVPAMHRASSLEMLNVNNTEFEEKRAFIASTLSLTDLLKPADYRGTPSPAATSQFQAGYPGAQQGQAFPGPATGPFQQNGYVVPQSLLKQHNQQQMHNPHNPNANGYNVNFLNNGVPDKELGKAVCWRAVVIGISVRRVVFIGGTVRRGAGHCYVQTRLDTESQIASFGLARSLG
jgi:hypothetical protein